jgi:ATP-grasp ribosomal peptide maturase
VTTTQCGRDTILVIAAATDPMADRVADALRARGSRFFRFDTADFPQRLQLEAELDGHGWQCTVATKDEIVNLRDVTAVYVRRPRSFEPPAHLTSAEQWHSAIESRYAWGGLLASLPDIRWCNKPSRSADAAYKPRQLADFRSCGLTTPATLLTNSPNALRRFAAKVGRVVCKSIVVGVVRTDQTAQAVYTHLLTPDDLDDLAGVEYSAHLFQEFINKEFDVRLTVIGDQFFAIRINAGSERACVDWRSDYQFLTYDRIETPSDVRAAVNAYLKMTGLSFGAFDFSVTPEGVWNALEINPEGQWGWIEQETGAPITEAISTWLMEKTL